MTGTAARAQATGPTAGSLCTGYGGLDMAVEKVFGARTVWHCQYDPADRNQYAARILAHNYPAVPNHGDITAVPFGDVEPVDILSAGFPCQDLSLAGKHAGLKEGTRSGLWFHVARAIRLLHPRLVVIENVPGILSAKADRGMGADSGDMAGGTGTGITLRALGAVLGDLADLGFDAEWQSVRASDVGAPHRRERVFILARPAADAHYQGSERPGTTRRAALRHPSGQDRPATHPAREGLESRWKGRAGGVFEASEDADGAARSKRRQPAPGEAESGRARTDTGGRDRIPHPVSRSEFGDFTDAVNLWQEVRGVPAPPPVDSRRRLDASFVEWMMGLPTGHVTGVPHMPRSAQLKALGNGVVPQQAEFALRLLAGRLFGW